MGTKNMTVANEMGRSRIKKYIWGGKYECPHNDSVTYLQMEDKDTCQTLHTSIMLD